MADTFTTNTGMTKPENGASTDTWGAKLNVNLDILDAIFAGDGTGTSVGMQVGSGKTLKVSGTLNLTGATLTGLTKTQVDTAQGGAAVLLAGAQTVAGIKTFADGLVVPEGKQLTVTGATIVDTGPGPHQLNITGNAGTVTNGLYTTNLSTTGGASKVPQYGTSGQLGLGVGSLVGSWTHTPSGVGDAEPTWGCEFGAHGFLASSQPNGAGEFGGIGMNGMVGTNAYYDGTNWRFKTGRTDGGTASATATLMRFGASVGSVGWYTASGVKDGVASWTKVAGVDGAGSYTQSSDERLKYDLRVVDQATIKVGQLTGYSYLRRDSDNINGREIGLLAQDVYKVAPEAVRTNEDGYLSVAYGNLVALLVEAVKELDARIQQLEAL